MTRIADLLAAGQTYSFEFPGQAFGSEPYIACVLRKGGNGRNAEQRFQFFKEARLLAAGKLERGWHESSLSS